MIITKKRIKYPLLQTIKGLFPLSLLFYYVAGDYNTKDTYSNSNCICEHKQKYPDVNKER